MKYQTVIDSNREEEVLIYVHERNRATEELERFIDGLSMELIGYRGESREIVRLLPSEVFCFVVEDGKIYAITLREKLQLKQRLYVIEEMLDQNFVKINQSCIANIRKIKRFDASIGGSLTVIFSNGYKDYVSRRQLKIVKERIGFRL